MKEKTVRQRRFRSSNFGMTGCEDKMDAEVDEEMDEAIDDEIDESVDSEVDLMKNCFFDRSNFLIRLRS